MKEKIVVLFNEPKYYIEHNWLVWEGFVFDTDIQDYVTNFMYQIHQSHDNYFLVYESDLKKSKKYPHYLQYYSKRAGKWLDTYLNEVHVIPNKKGGCIFSISY